MKHQALFSSKDKSKNLKCHLLQFLFSALRVNLLLYFSRISMEPWTVSVWPSPVPLTDMEPFWLWGVMMVEWYSGISSPGV